jgi:hypothetical protein
MAYATYVSWVISPEGRRAIESGARAIQNGIDITGKAIVNAANWVGNQTKNVVEWISDGAKSALDNFMFSKGGKQNVKNTGLSGLSDAEIANKLKDPNTSKEEKQKLQREQKARGNRNKPKRGKK